MKVYSLYFDIYKNDKIVNFNHREDFENELCAVFNEYYGVRFYVENIVSKNIAKIKQFDYYERFETFMQSVIEEDNKYLRILINMLKIYKLKLKISYISYFQDKSLYPTKNFNNILNYEISENGVKSPLVMVSKNKNNYKLKL